MFEWVSIAASTHLDFFLYFLSGELLILWLAYFTKASEVLAIFCLSDSVINIVDHCDIFQNVEMVSISMNCIMAEGENCPSCEIRL